MDRQPNGMITLLTDFGLSDPYVGIMKGAIKRYHPRAEIIDLCHAVPAQNVEIGAFFLASAVGQFSPGTVHLAVVDPGVGMDRRMLVIYCQDCLWVGPDNGVLEGVLPADDRPSEVRCVDIDGLGLPVPSNTFHGRDLFAPVAAMISRGQYGFRALGPRIEDPVRGRSIKELGLRVLCADGFGNLITGITAREVSELGITAIEVAGLRVPLCSAYGEVEVGTALAVLNSYGLVEIAINGGNAASSLGVSDGDLLEVVTEEES
ncbi:MAG: hypothetical protein CMJ81_13435 [Planctomycetaceae bacterium]|nr:hypothetical protein [Planctomycetaceae bacterium]